MNHNTLPSICLVFALFFATAFTLNAQQIEEKGAAIGVEHTFEPRGLMGGGAAFFDYDQDGNEDLYLTGGLNPDALYANNGDGTFSKILEDIGLGITAQYNTTAVITGDIDNDGDREIFLSTWERYENGNEIIANNLLFNNNGDGTFSEISNSAGLTDAAFSIGANFMDFDRDGFLDIYVINHVETPAFLFDDYGAIVGFDHDCYPNYLYHNNGDGTFTEMADALGLDDESCTLASIPTDFDMDGDIDLYLANDFGPFIIPNLMYENEYPSAQFTEISAQNGTDIPMYGMGVAIGDYDHDQDFDYYITNLGSNVLLENDGSGNFTDNATTAGVTNEFSGTDFATGWGTAFLDIDNDSWLDLFVSNGRIPSLPTLPTAFNDTDKLYLNNGDKTFTDITDEVNVGDPQYGRGMAYADFDMDGDLDFLVVNLSELGGTSKFYVNETQNDHHYVQFKLVGTDSNRDAYGSKLWLYADGQVYLREITGGGASFCSQHSSIAHFGLNTNTQIDSLTVEWISGNVEHYKDLSVDNFYTIEESSLSTSIDPLAASPTTAKLTLAPNPFDNYLTIQTKNVSEQEAWMTLYDTSNKLIFEQRILLTEAPQKLLLPENISAGLYLLRIESKEAVFIEKVIKQ